MSVSSKDAHNHSQVQLSDLNMTNIYAVQNAPEGFVQWAVEEKGALEIEDTEKWDEKRLFRS